MNKPKVLICVLTGSERTHWICPDLLLNLIQMVKDPRFDCEVFPIRDYRPHEVARNIAIVAARSRRVDWCLQIDNDNYLLAPNSPLDVIEAAGNNKFIVGMAYGMGTDGQGFRIFPDPIPGTADGKFFEAQSLGGGMMAIHHSVWERIRGPWFKWGHSDSETLAGPDACGEDRFFCNMARQHGIKSYVYQHVLGHSKTVDISRMVSTLFQLSGARK